MLNNLNDIKDQSVSYIFFTLKNGLGVVTGSCVITEY